MELLDKIGKKATKTYKVTAEKTSKLAKETKLKIAMSMNKSNISDLYEEIGKKVYEKYLREEKIEIKEELLELCAQIDILASEIEEARVEILHLKDKKQCFHCFYEMDIDAHFCPNCGIKQTKEEEIRENQKKQEEDKKKIEENKELVEENKRKETQINGEEKTSKDIEENIEPEDDEIV